MTYAPMSALGQKRTSRTAIAMSAFPPRADIPRYPLFVNDYADGLIHTEVEHRIWLKKAGFEYVLREPSAPSYAADFILARKPG